MLVLWSLYLPHESFATELTTLTALLAVHWMPRNESQLRPGKLTWNLKIMQLKRKIIFQTSMFGFHVNFPGSIVNLVGIPVSIRTDSLFSLVKLQHFEAFFQELRR